MNAWFKWFFIGSLLIAAIATPVSQAQTPPPAVSVYSIWLRMSLRGYSQEEIESALRNMDPKTIDDVKARLRRAVMSNLRLKKVRDRFHASRDRRDLQDVASAIQTEIRFAGLENDEELRRLIEESFGIPLSRL